MKPKSNKRSPVCEIQGFWAHLFGPYLCVNLTSDHLTYIELAYFIGSVNYNGRDVGALYIMLSFYYCPRY